MLGNMETVLSIRQMLCEQLFIRQLQNAVTEKFFGS